MIRSLSRTVCCRFVNLTANLTVIRIANPFAIRFVIRFANLIASQNRIDCQTHFVSRFANRYHSGHSIPNCLWFLNCPMIHWLMIHCQRNHYRMSRCRSNRCFLMVWNRMIRLDPSSLSFRSFPKSRFAIHCQTIHCQTSHYRMSHCQMNLTNPRIRSMVRCFVAKIPSYLTSLNYPMNRSCLTSRSILMSLSCHSNPNCRLYLSFRLNRSYRNFRSSPSHCFPSSRSTRSIRWFPSCRFVWRSHHFHWLHCFPIRSRMNHCCHSIPRSHLNPTSQTSR
jgi:hypothetical protein